MPNAVPPEPLRVLCLDIEGGHGGSSRSLFEFVRHLDRGDCATVVWCRREGPAAARYRAIGVPCRVEPTMPKVSSLPRLSRNLVVYARAVRDFRRARTFRRALAEAVDGRFDLVHFNHEALFLLARWLRPRTDRPFTMHIRTNLHDTAFARWQIATVSRTMDHLVFITENEAETFARLGGRPRAASVIHNIAAPPPSPVAPHAAVPRDGRFRIACLSNYSWGRGLDRLAEVARALAAAGRRDVLFVMAGDMALSRSLPGALGRTARRGGTLADYMREQGVGEMFLFLGHVDAPEEVLAACEALIKPTRENNPWGRDIIEALAAGRPVLSVGTYDRFVETGRTGMLQARFDAGGLAREIIRWADDRALVRRLGAAGRARVARLCDGPARAADLLAVWRGARRG